MCLYVIWLERHLRPAIQAHVFPEDPALFRSMDTRNILKVIAGGDVAELLDATLLAAWSEVIARLGDDPAEWAWGSLHQTSFQHPLQHLADGELAGHMRLPSYPRGGSSHTTNNTGYYNDDLQVDAGASYRQVIDVGNWDATRMTNAPGQSGDPRSPFFDNLLQGWAEEKSFPLLYSREEIEKNAAFTISLRPAQ
jgi:penicillin amidase